MSQIHPRPATILLVEDDPGDQELIRRCFADNRIGNTLHIVEDGEQALDYLLQRGAYADAAAPQPDLVLLDLNLPRLDGQQVLERIRSTPAIHHLPVVVLTTSRAEIDILRSYDLGANSFICKPFEIEEFVEVLSALKQYWLQIVKLPTK